MPTGRGATFLGVEFYGLQYADLINHKLNTPVRVPLRWTHARLAESNIDGIPAENVISASAFLESPYSSRTIGLVRDGWLPSGIALQTNMVVLPDRCTITELKGRFRDGVKTTETDKDFLDLFAGSAVRINPLLFALEGNVRSNPPPDVIEQQFDAACRIITEALPEAELVPQRRAGLQGAIGIMHDTQASMTRKQNFLMQLAPLLRTPVATKRVDALWDTVLAAADSNGVSRHSLVVLAALSAVCVPNGKSPAKRLLKLNVRDYRPEDAYNALADLRSLEVLMHLFALFPKEKILLCTGDKDLALFWAGIRATNFSQNNGHCSFTLSPIEELFPYVSDTRKSSYFSSGTK